MSAASPFDRSSTRELKRQRTRSRLFDAALAEFARVGFDRASVAEIARMAGVSRPSFYFHFPTRDHVLLELQWREEVKLVARLEACATLTELLRALPDAILDSFESIEGPEVARDMVRIYARRPQHLPLAEQPFPLLRLVERRFADGAARGELRPDLDPARATRLCLTGIFGYLITADDTSDRRADLRALVSLYVNGDR